MSDNLPVFDVRDDSTTNWSATSTPVAGMEDAIDDEFFRAPRFWNQLKNKGTIADIDLPSAPSFHSLSENSAPVQLWEGTVTDVDDNSVSARLRARIGELPEHDVTISREWIHDQDVDLVYPGAVFYLTVYKTSLRGSIRNGEEIRFRRLPSWSNADIERLESAVARLVEKLGPPVGQ